ncbi:hypothetical protein Lpar_1878 [Legionella parisiensis]|uniref:Uncharacterized protein n=1 Tax=Legionella parisiensis TaxID=45071 RepID=A0A1E5JNR9_9GAMM|nr:hypothetical protein [Legionella parisiensis]KTD40561.1 hypothetical protein Lpar_1878 [Legionella parisiensis]OEH46184.1 hypothetical protein lpari_02829 [Legionella parisiensis]STX77046.1 Uncharacterised protein [Legionella parisiensis]
MSLRQKIAKSLDPALRTSPGLSVLNKIITIIIILSLLLAIVETERSIYQGNEWLFLSSEWIFTITFACLKNMRRYPLEDISY